jgi:hypothetical protein
LGSPFGCQSLPALRQLPTSSFFCVHGDHGLACRLGRKHFGIDVFELGVAIGVARALIGFPVDLPRETDLGEQLAHAVGADRVAHGDKRRRQLVETLRHP